MGTAVDQLIRILTASIAPVIVISGVGLLLLSMINSYGRVIFRARELIKDIDAAEEGPRRNRLLEQVRIIYRRARILRVAIILSSASILFVAVTVPNLTREFGQQTDKTREATYFGFGRSANPCPGLELRRAQCFQGGEIDQTANLAANGARYTAIGETEWQPRA